MDSHKRELIQRSASFRSRFPGVHYALVEFFCDKKVYCKYQDRGGHEKVVYARCSNSFLDLLSKSKGLYASGTTVAIYFQSLNEDGNYIFKRSHTANYQQAFNANRIVLPVYPNPDLIKKGGYKFQSEQYPSGAVVYKVQLP